MERPVHEALFERLPPPARAALVAAAFGKATAWKSVAALNDSEGRYFRLLRNHIRAQFRPDGRTKTEGERVVEVAERQAATRLKNRCHRGHASADEDAPLSP